MAGSSLSEKQIRELLDKKCRTPNELYHKSVKIYNCIRQLHEDRADFEDWLSAITGYFIEYFNNQFPLKSKSGNRSLKENMELFLMYFGTGEEPVLNSRSVSKIKSQLALLTANVTQPNIKGFSSKQNGYKVRFDLKTNPELTLFDLIKAANSIFESLKAQGISHINISLCVGTGQDLHWLQISMIADKINYHTEQNEPLQVTMWRGPERPIRGSKTYISIDLNETLKIEQVATHDKIAAIYTAAAELYTAAAEKLAPSANVWFVEASTNGQQFTSIARELRQICGQTCLGLPEGEAEVISSISTGQICGEAPTGPTSKNTTIHRLA